MIIKNSAILLLVSCFYSYIFCMNSNQSKTDAKDLYSSVPKEIWNKIQDYSPRPVSEKILPVIDDQKHNEPFKYYDKPFKEAPHIQCSITINNNQPKSLVDRLLYWQKPHDYGRINVRDDTSKKKNNNEETFCFGPFHRGAERAYIINDIIGIADNRGREVNFPTYGFSFLLPARSLPVDYVMQYLTGKFVACDNKNKCLYTIKPDTGLLIRHQYDSKEDIFKQDIIQNALASGALLQLLPKKLKELHSLCEDKYKPCNYNIQIDPRNSTIFLISYKNKRNNSKYKLYSRESSSVIHTGECLPHETVLLDQGLPEGLRILGNHTALRVVTIGEKFDFTSVYLVGLMHHAQNLARYIRSNKITPDDFNSAYAILTDFKKNVPTHADRYFWVYQSKNDDGSYGMKILHDYVLAMVIASEVLRIQKQAVNMKKKSQNDVLD